MKNKLLNLIGTTAITLASLLPMKGEAQEKQLKYVNPFWHPENPEWNSSNKHEKIQMLEEAFQTDSIWKGGKPEWDWSCGDFAFQSVIDYKGFPKLETDELNIKNLDKFVHNNGKYKIPAMSLHTRTTWDEAHAINGVLVGNDIRNFDDWYFWEPQNSPQYRRNIVPGEDWSMGKDAYVDIVYRDYLENYINTSGDTMVRCRSPPDIVQFQLTDGEPSVKTEPQDYVVLINPSIDKTPPEITTTLNESGLEYQVSDANLNEISYNLNNSSNKNLQDTSGFVSLDLKIGQNTLYFSATDKAGNISEKTLNYEIEDTTQNSISKHSISEIGKPYPNPTNSKFTIPYESNKKATFNLYNSQGKNLETKTIESSSKEVQFDISKQPAGIYFYSTSEGYKGKIVKE